MLYNINLDVVTSALLFTLQDYLHRRQGIPVKIRFPNHLDKTHRRKILGFLSENGWISGIGSA